MRPDVAVTDRTLRNSASQCPGGRLDLDRRSHYSTGAGQSPDDRGTALIRLGAAETRHTATPGSSGHPDGTHREIRWRPGANPTGARGPGDGRTEGDLERSVPRVEQGNTPVSRSAPINARPEPFEAQPAVPPGQGIDTPPPLP